jgi:hypothetical protein
MRAEGIQGAKRRSKPWRTTKPDPVARRHPDLVQRDFAAATTDRLWVADLSYLRCWEGRVFFAFVIDAFSRRVVGWRLASHMRTTLVVDALRMALGTRWPGADVALVHHSDRARPDRPPRRPARAAGPGTARVRQAPARLPRSDAPLLRHRAADVDHDPRRARRRAPLLLPARGRALRRPGHPRPPIRRAPRPGRLSRQGPAVLRWALFESRPMRPPARLARPSPHYLQTTERLGGNRACLAVTRKLLTRSYHTLRELGEEALAPA